jgi:phage shock protein PspC (stress-responsive transcriptional regulator)
MNLSGIIFHIEEDAYEKLNKYLSTIRSYFNDADSRDEIMSDIEARIAEMLQEKVSTSKQAVLMSDVDSVISQMGKPEEFAEGAEKSENREEKREESNAYRQGKRRRVFRDPDEKLLGGVCSGIANYFDFDPIWLRGAFAISFFVFGTGLLLYIILWLIIPEAKTTAEKLEMRGEKVDINNISKAVSEEFEGVKKRMEDLGDKVRSYETKEKVRSSAQKATDFVGDVFHNMIRILAKIFAVFFVILAVVIVVILLGSVFGSTNVIHFSDRGKDYAFSLYEWASNFLPDSSSPNMFLVGLVLVLGIPLLSIIYSGVKFLLGIKQRNKYIRYTTNGLWLVGVAIMIVIGIQIINDFKEEVTIKNTVDLQQKDTLYLSMKGYNEYIDPSYKKYGDRRVYHVGRLKWDYMNVDNDGTSFSSPVEIDIIPSMTDSFEVMEIRSANGGTKKDAAFRARSIRYSFSQKDSLLEFEPSYKLDLKDKWRAQDIKLVLKVPLNKVIYLNRGMEYLIYDVDNTTNTLDRHMIGRRWIMKKEGLTCIDCVGLDDEETMTFPPSAPPVHVPAPPAPVIDEHK